MAKTNVVLHQSPLQTSLSVLNISVLLCLLQYIVWISKHALPKSVLDVLEAVCE